MHVFFHVYGPKVFPEIASTSKSIRDQCSNRGAAAMHAVSMFSLTLYYWNYVNPTMEYSRTVHPYLGMMIDVMNGYMIYDTINEISTTGEADVILHHVMGLLTHVVARVINSGMSAYFFGMVYIAEASTPLLHFSWLLYHINWANTIIFKTTVLLVVIVFLFCRVLLAPWMDWKLYESYFETEPVGVWWTDDEAMYWINVVIMFIFTILNFFWYYKLVATAVKGITKPNSKLD